MFQRRICVYRGVEEAINRWIIYKQDCLRQQPNFQRLCSPLNWFEDCQNILQLKGRFGNSLLEYFQNYPIILREYESLFTRLLIVDADQRSLHRGIEFTLNCVRLKFWICKGRKIVKRVLRDCVICKRYQASQFYLPLAQTSQIFELIFRHTHSSLLD